jgi:hypothetical protein
VGATSREQANNARSGVRDVERLKSEGEDGTVRRARSGWRRTAKKTETWMETRIAQTSADF